ncbi:sodium/proline symporter PutP [Leadbettera azotonutricia]|uniref:Sodium/proline symporter n=1 Tax=Leadbettera azotonutricia (strain ATCC BAA-888 / DSM 13862 / ZAS-9) TaxID=545695 RepID=F5YAI1_LEAAZ|nr:sodium/proline symporter PutP [Leadbettera azotonutricia]AEF82522.1 sodium/proline symporter [Leadbettera azotonutricia ZAS-9]
MNTGNVQTLIGMGGYLVVMIVIGLWYARRSNSNPEEYFLGKRGLGPWVAAMSAEASDMSGWLLMGLPGVAYFTGMGEAFWTALGLFIGTWINWAVVAKRLRGYSQIANNSITLPDFFSNRYHDKKRILMSIAAIIIIVFFSIYASAQFVTFGKLFGYVFGTDNLYTAMVILGAALVMIYTLLGGFLAESMTDLIQSFMMIGALLLVLIFGFAYAGGFSAVAENLKSFPRFTDIFGIATPAVENGVQKVINGVPQFGPGANYGFLTIISTLAWGLGYFGMPHVLVRFMAIKKTSMIRQSRAMAVIWCFIAQAAAVLIGIMGRAYLPGLLTTASSAENIFLHLSQNFFPPLVAGLVISGILAASMSSSDSYMLIASSAVANDLVKGLIKKDASEAFVMWVARITMLAVTVFGVVLALSGNQSIFRVVSYAWAGFGAAFGPLVLFSLFWKRTTFPAAVAGMVTGGAMVLIWKNFIAKLGGVFNVYELLPAFVLSCLVIWIVSLLTQKPDASIEAEFEKARTAEF